MRSYLPAKLSKLGDLLMQAVRPNMERAGHLQHQQLQSMSLYKFTAGNGDVSRVTPPLRVAKITRLPAVLLACSTPSWRSSLHALLSACITRSLDPPVRTRLTTDCTPQLRVWKQNSTIKNFAWLRHKTAVVLADRGSTAVCLFSSLQCCSRATENSAVHLSLATAS